MRFDTDVSIKIRDAYASRHEPEAAHYLAGFFWTFMVMVTFVVMFSGVAYGAWEFLQPLRPSAAESVSVPQKKVFSTSELQKMLETLGNRAQQYQNAKIAPVPVKDPS